ncbi:MAG: transcription termination/antitermination NusG family protein, partial [Myxococcota bacterium]
MAFRLIEGTHWWALRTKSNFEKTVADQLSSRKLEAFLPTYRTFSKRKDRRKVITLPLFSGYLFVHTDLSEYKNRLQVVQTRGVVNIVGGPEGPLPVRPHEIDSIRLMCGS